MIPITNDPLTWAGHQNSEQQGLSWSLVQRMFTQGRLWAPRLWKVEEGFGPGRSDNSKSLEALLIPQEILGFKWPI